MAYFDVLEKNVQACWLLDFYGAMLTQKQQEMLSLYYEEDMSLTEIATQYSVSRQNVYDIVQRAIKQLIKTENQLKLIERTLTSQKNLELALKQITNIANNLNSSQQNLLNQAKQNILNAITQFEGE